jgi:hypothetical protein
MLQPSLPTIKVNTAADRRILSVRMAVIWELL